MQIEERSLNSEKICGKSYNIKILLYSSWPPRFPPTIFISQEERYWVRISRRMEGDDNEREQKQMFCNIM